MDTIIQAIEDWFRDVLTEGIITNLTGLFDQVNEKVGEISGQVGSTPQDWNAAIFNMVQNLSENVMVPIAGVILAIVMTLELIQMIVERNNFHNDVDTFQFFKWAFKTAGAVLIVTNTWNIVMAVFDLGHEIIVDSAGIVIGDTSIDMSLFLTDLESKLAAMSIGGLIGLWMQSGIVKICMGILQICILVVVFGRMIEIYRASRSAACNPQAVRGHFGNPALASR